MSREEIRDSSFYLRFNRYNRVYNTKLMNENETLLSIVVPNRNRKIKTIKKLLDSIQDQLSEKIHLSIVDYGSDLGYQQKLEVLVRRYSKVQLILCPTQGQLFHKTRAINIVLRKSTSTYFMVLDMDCICHPHFIDKALELVELGNPVNFPYGFLSEEESKLDRSFKDYKVDFIGGLTGTAIFKTNDLLQLNGFDEIYHNWGAEDAHMFERLERFGITTTHFKDELLLLHQWHRKQYRNKESKLPYHSTLEQINHKYFQLSRKLKRTKANQSLHWGLGFDKDQYNKLLEPTLSLELNSTQEEISALCLQLKESWFEGTLLITIREHKYAKALKTRLKKILRIKHPSYISLMDSNRLLLETIISNHRNQPYTYFKSEESIRVSLFFQSKSA